MNYIIGCDAHKRYSQFAVFEKSSEKCTHFRVEHEPGAIREFLSGYSEGTPVALESIGNWYWIVDEIEEAGCLPSMAHAAKAKVMMGNVNKTDKRELIRTRMVMCKIRVSLKNRLHATLAKYNLSVGTDSDIFGEKWEKDLQRVIQALPSETLKCVQQELKLLDDLQRQIDTLEQRMRELIPLTPQMLLLKTLPGIGDILSIVVACEIGSIERFHSAEGLASYAGTVPTVKSSGGKTRYGHLPAQSNHYLKWAFIEAGNVVSRWRNHPKWRTKHVTQLYERTRQRKEHAVVVGAVARHLAEATYWMLSKNQVYQEPALKKVPPKQE